MATCSDDAPPLAVRRFELRRYKVRSERIASTWYVVDLDGCDGKQCDCMDDSCRITPAIVRGEEPPREHCKHKRAVLATLEHAAELAAMLGYPAAGSERLIPLHHEP